MMMDSETAHLVAPTMTLVTLLIVVATPIMFVDTRSRLDTITDRVTTIHNHIGLDEDIVVTCTVPLGPGDILDKSFLRPTIERLSASDSHTLSVHKDLSLVHHTLFHPETVNGSTSDLGASALPWVLTLANGTHDLQQKLVQSEGTGGVVDIRTNFGTFRTQPTASNADLRWDAELCRWFSADNRERVAGWLPGVRKYLTHNPTEFLVAQGMIPFVTLGLVVAASENGHVLAFGVPDQNRVYLFHLVDLDATQLGSCPGYAYEGYLSYSDIDVPDPAGGAVDVGPNFGGSLKLSCDGSVLVVGADQAFTVQHETHQGAVFVFARNLTSHTFQSPGTRLEMALQADTPGRLKVLALSCSGTRLLVADPQSGASGSRIGHATLYYRADTSSAFAVAATFAGSGGQPGLGTSGDLALEGQLVALGSPVGGIVRLYHVVLTGTPAATLSLTITDSAFFGHSVALTRKGDRLAASKSVYYTPGEVRIFALTPHATDRNIAATRTQTLAPGGLGELAFSNDGSVLAFKRPVTTTAWLYQEPQEVVVYALDGGSESGLYAETGQVYRALHATDAGANDAFGDNLALYAQGRGLLVGYSTAFSEESGGAEVADTDTIGVIDIEFTPDPTKPFDMVLLGMNAGTDLVRLNYMDASFTALNAFDTGFSRDGAFNSNGSLFFVIGTANLGRMVDFPAMTAHANNATLGLSTRMKTDWLRDGGEDRVVVCYGTDNDNLEIFQYSGSTFGTAEAVAMHTLACNDVLCQPNSSHCVSLDTDSREVYVWETETFALTHDLSAVLQAGDGPQHLSFSADGTRLALVGSHSTTVFDTTANYTVLWRHVDNSSALHYVAVHPTKPVVAVTRDPEEQFIFHLETGQLLHSNKAKPCGGSGCEYLSLAWGLEGDGQLLIGVKGRVRGYAVSVNQPLVEWFT
jgi:WD40 repeat protein